jgi:hypothetical protein
MALTLKILNIIIIFLPIQPKSVDEMDVPIDVILKKQWQPKPLNYFLKDVIQSYGSEQKNKTNQKIDGWAINRYTGSLKKIQGSWTLKKNKSNQPIINFFLTIADGDKIIQFTFNGEKANSMVQVAYKMPSLEAMATYGLLKTRYLTMENKNSFDLKKNNFDFLFWMNQRQNPIKNPGSKIFELWQYQGSHGDYDIFQYPHKNLNIYLLLKNQRIHSMVVHRKSMGIHIIVFYLKGI